MVPYCINTIICSGLLFFLYKALIENEKMHVFKRFYLLFSIAISLTVPLITISFYSEANQPVALQYFSNEPVDFIMEQSPVRVEEQTNKIIVFVIIAYVSGLMISLFRFVKKVSYFSKAHKGAEQILFNQAILVLLQEEVVPHSFMNSIFLNKQEFKNRLIQDEILQHELTHVKQLHSLDVLFVQLLQCIFWFNPFFIFYKRAIQLNHEFLADESVVKSSKKPLSYQYLLLNKASGNNMFSLASQFNYSIIKKRLVMITQETSPRIALLKKMAIIPLLAMTVFLFAKKETIAQQAETTKTGTEVPSTKEGVSQELLNEYESILSKYRNDDDKTQPYYSYIPEKEKNRLIDIYKMMSKEQQDKQTTGFLPTPPVKEKRHPTEMQLKEWVDAKRYFVRIDGWKIKNSQLDDYKPSDFDYYDFYEPNKGATDYGKYDAQINLMTKEAYARYAKAWGKETLMGPIIFIKRLPKAK
jgi:bla regulator protein blaR1